MAKANLNYIIGIDVIDDNVKIMRVTGDDPTSAYVDYIPYESRLLNEGDFGGILSGALAKYLENVVIDQSVAVHLVLPNSLIGSDLFVVPTFKQSKMLEALNTQMENLYPFIKDYKINVMPLVSNKVNTTFQVFMCSKPILNKMYTALALNKMYVKSSTYASASTTNAILQLNAKLRKKSFIIVDMKQTSTDYIMCTNGVTTGQTHIPLGHKILLSDKVLRESTLYNHDIAELAVINATERARRKTMTESFLDEEDENLIEQQALSVNELDAASISEAERLEQVQKNLEESGELPVKEVSDIDDEELDEEEEAKKFEELAKAEEKVMAEKAAKKIMMRKLPRKLPKFMQRPIPETQEGIVAENFRIFAKRALLMNMYNSNDAVLSNPEFVLVNMPAQFSYIIEQFNSEEDTGIEFRFLDLSEYKNNHIGDNLDLFGALFTKQYNKFNNF